jgi:hypothetical protein
MAPTSNMMSPPRPTLCMSLPLYHGLTITKNQQYPSSPMTTAPTLIYRKKNPLPTLTTTSITSQLLHTSTTSPQLLLGLTTTKLPLCHYLSTLKLRIPTKQPQRSSLPLVIISTGASLPKTTYLTSQLKPSGVSTMKSQQGSCTTSINPLSLIALKENPPHSVHTTPMIKQLGPSSIIHLFLLCGLITMSNLLSLSTIMMKDQTSTLKTVSQALKQATISMIKSPSLTTPTFLRKLTGPITTPLLHSLFTTTTNPLRST